MPQDTATAPTNGWNDFVRTSLRGLRGTLPYDREWRITETGEVVMIETDEVSGPWPPERERPATLDERRAICATIKAAVDRL